MLNNKTATTNGKLTLSTETVRPLNPRTAINAAGGQESKTCNDPIKADPLKTK